MKITYNELIRSNKAVELGIDNVPRNEEEENLNQLINWLNGTIAPMVPEPVGVNSGFRNDELNKAVGGAATSHHRLGYAADLTCANLVGLVNVLKDHIDQIDQLIYYPKRGFVHVSIHPRMRNEYFLK